MGYNRTPNTVIAGRGLKQSPSVTGTVPVGVVAVTVDGDIATTNSLGLVQVGSGLAIDPLGVLSASGGGNYSSGAWTPGLAGPAAGTITLTIKNAKFTKVGQLVTCFFDFKVTNIATGIDSSILYLTGLPFLSITDTGTVGSVYTSYWEFMDLNLVEVSGTVISSDTKALLWKANSPQSSLSSLVRSDIQVGSTLAGTVVYFSAS